MILARLTPDIASILSAMEALSHTDIQRRIASAVQATYPDQYCSVVDVFGSDSEGEVVYYHANQLWKAPYSISLASGLSTVTVANAKAQPVVPSTSYDVVAVAAAETDAGTSPAEKGAESVSICEGLALPAGIKVREGKAGYEVKLIAPGKGSSAFYTPEALKSGERVFRAGTHMYWNHPSKSEESDRPERDLDSLAAVLTTDAQYRENGAQGPGLYARMKVFSDYQDRVKEKASVTGVSVLAYGVAEMKNGKPLLQEGVPLLKEFVQAQSVDFVTKPGAGGMVVTESQASSSAPAKQEVEESDMDVEAIKRLEESNRELSGKLAKMVERSRLMDAALVSREVLSGLSLTKAIAERVHNRVMVGAIPATEAGELDREKFRAIVETEAKDEMKYIESLGGRGVVTGVGESTPPALDPERIKEAAEDLAISLGLSKESAKYLAMGREA